MSRSWRSLLLVASLSLAPQLAAVPARAQGTVIASDDFNRADETPFATTGNWGRTIAGNYDGTSALVGNRVTAVSNEGIYYWRGAGTFDATRQFARQHVVSNAGEMGLVLLGGADQSIMVSWGPPGVNNTVYIYWYANGADHGQLLTAPSTVQNGDILEAVLDGGVIYAKVNGVTVASVPNTTTLTTGTPGFITYLNPGLPGQVAMMDDWQAGTPPTIPNGGDVAADDFNRADETPLAIGGNWQQPFGGGAANLAGNHVAGNSGEALYYWQGGGTFDNAHQSARLKVVQASGQVGLVLLGAANQAIVTAWNGGTLFIYWYSAGTYRGNLTTMPSTLQDGDIIEAQLDGGTIYAKINGVVVKTVANTTTLTSGHPGFETYQSGAILDDWEGGSPQAYSISGTVTENAAGLSGVLVTASGGFSGSATTNGTGEYTIIGVPPSATSIVLTPTKSGRTFSPTSRTISGPTISDVTGEDFTSTPNPNNVLTIVATHGTVTRDPDQPSYPFGTDVTLTPVPDAGYSFTGWSGDVPAGHGTDNPLHVTMDQDRTIFASFVPPGTIAVDHFDRADETPFAVGGNWVQPFGGGVDNLTNNHVASVSGEALYSWQGPGTFDNTRQFARARVLQAGGQVGMVLLGGPNQALVVSWGGGRLYIYWYLNGSHQGELANIAATLNDGDMIEGVLTNGTVYAKVNGVVIKSVPNSTSLTSGRPGFETYLSGAVFDDWEAGTPPSYSISGTITENAAGLGGVLVRASGGFSGSATTAGNGGYTISGVPLDATSIVLAPTRVGHDFTPSTRTIAGPVTDDVTGQDFTGTPNGAAADIAAADDFDRPDETQLAVGANWEHPFNNGGFASLTNQHVTGINGEALYYWTGPGTFDTSKQFARATVLNAGGQVGLVLLGATNQALVVAWHDGTLFFYWYSGGSYQGNIATFPSTLQNGDIVEARLEGGIVSAKINGTVVASTPNTTTLTSGKPGFETFLGGATFDNWEAGPPPQFEILASAGGGGTIAPSGSVLVYAGANQSFTIAPDACHVVSGVLVDGSSVGAVSSYTFTDVQAGHTIGANFSLIPPTIAAVTGVAATQQRSGNDHDGTTKIALAFSPPIGAALVEVWRKGFGNYPLYDNAPESGSVPAMPASYPPAGWSLTAVTASGQSDEPSTRDYWYYVAYAKDACGNASPVSAMTTGALDYHLGDVSDGVTPGHGNNDVNTADLSLLGAHYGLSGASLSAFAYLDVGPTSNHSATGLPLTDSRTDFEDLVIFALNFPSATFTGGTTLASGTNVLEVSGPATVNAGDAFDVPIMLTAAGDLQALSVALGWDAAVVEPVSVTTGDLIAAQNGVMFSPAPGQADATLLGALRGITGQGAVAIVRFQAVSTGAPRIVIRDAIGRDGSNHDVAIMTHGPLAVGSGPVRTEMAPMFPNPVRNLATLDYSLAARGNVDLSIYSVDGRRLKTLVHGVRESGRHHVTWNGTDERGANVQAGVFFVKFEALGVRKTQAISVVH